MKGKERLHVR